MLSLSSFIENFINNDVLKCGKMPKHVAFVMDGNRRYSKIKGIPRKSAYKLGAENLVNMIPIAYEHSIEEISFYTFSLDNFGRCEEEQNEIFQSLKEVLESKIIDEIKLYQKLGIYVRFVGKTDLLPDYMQELGHKLEKLTRPSNDNDIKLTVNINIAYSAYFEICKATESIAKRVQLGQINMVDLKNFEECLYAKKSRPVDLMIRSSGEIRKSDFLLWESSNSVYFSVEDCWPELNQFDLFRAILYYQQEYF